MEDLWPKIKNNLNFFRIHLIAFTLTPLIFSAIFYASNGEFHISYIDGLYCCVSAMTVTGLATIDLSECTGFQQALLFILQCLGNTVTVSWIMVYIRRHYFAKKFEHIIEAELARRRAMAGDAEQAGFTTAVSRTFSRVFTRQTTRPTRTKSIQEKSRPRTFLAKSRSISLRKLRPDMIRRMDAPPQPINPSGILSRQESRRMTDSPRKMAEVIDEKEPEKDLTSSQELGKPDDGPSSSEHSDATTLPLRPIPTIEVTHTSGVPLPERHANPTFARTQTVDFRTPSNDHIRARRQSMAHTATRSISRRPDLRRGSTYYLDRERNSTMPTYRSSTMHEHRASRPVMERGFGGFPTPQTIFLRLLGRLFPNLKNRIVKRVTVPRTMTLASVAGGNNSGQGVPYLSFNAIVGRNSKFHMLTEENLEELGGAEYRGLTALLWIVASYHIGIQLIAFIVIAPYISTPRWRSAFEPPQLHRYVPPVWFSAFQVVSAYTNTGFSLVDQSMIPFQKAYPMIIFMSMCILLGNTAFPIGLRFTIWTISKILPRNTKFNETLQFLLDHPRRCFIYLFPSHQTWFLLTVVVLLNATDWFFFLVLDIGNPEIEKIPIGTRFIIGLLQATAVRSSGFAGVSLSSLAPAVQVLYVLMMYVSIYPIALSVRSTNVYEEKSLGIFEDEPNSDDEQEPTGEGSRVAVWGRYLSWHARKQLAFDMWWIGLGIFLICIIERSHLQNPANLSWFTIFTIVFEMISAYGTVGLSLGVPYASYSFSGALSTLSKLIIIAMMIRGRHRGLPVAIDRAILLPFEFGGNGKDSVHRDPIEDLEEENDKTAEATNANTNLNAHIVSPMFKRDVNNSNETSGRKSDGTDNDNGSYYNALGVSGTGTKQEQDTSNGNSAVVDEDTSDKESRMGRKRTKS